MINLARKIVRLSSSSYGLVFDRFPLAITVGVFLTVRRLGRLFIGVRRSVWMKG